MFSKRGGLAIFFKRACSRDGSAARTTASRMQATLVGGTGTRDTSVSTIDVPAVGPEAEWFAAVLNSLESSKGEANAASTVTPSQSLHLAANRSVQDSMAMMGWLDRFPFGRKQGRPSTGREPLDPEVVRGLAQALKDSSKDSRQIQEALDRLTRELLGGETESEFTSLMSSIGHVASKVEHAVAGFGKMTDNYVANHAQEIGLSATAAAAAGGMAADAVDVVVSGLGAPLF
jgi:hypothetical protein